jgi:hypothetical protein
VSSILAQAIPFCPDPRKSASAGPVPVLLLAAEETHGSRL